MTDKVTTVVVGMPWYDGPNSDTYVRYMDFMLYLGALADRTVLRHRMGPAAFHALDLPPLALDTEADSLAEPTEADYELMGRLRIAVIDYSRTSLVGKARELIADSAVNIGADYLLWWDADMKFPYSAFLCLWRHQKPIVGALAFTAREPIFPVLFGVRTVAENDGTTRYEQSVTMFNYPRDTLVGDEHTDGWLAIGAGYTLIDCGVFSEIPKPWFNSTAAGEDWFFCARAASRGIARYCDTSVKVEHKAHAPAWCTEESYWKARVEQSDEYDRLHGKLVLPEDLR